MSELQSRVIQDLSRKQYSINRLHNSVNTLPFEFFSGLVFFLFVVYKYTPVLPEYTYCRDGNFPFFFFSYFLFDSGFIGFFFDLFSFAICTLVMLLGRLNPLYESATRYY